MIVTTLQQQKYDITNPIKKFCIYDPLYMDNKDVSYVNNRIPSALVGKVVVKETRFEMEEDDILPQFSNVKVKEVGKLQEVRVFFAPTVEIIDKAYLNDNFFRGTIAKDLTLYTSSNYFVVETEKGLLIINSCSHGGAANILTDVKSVFPDKRIYGYIGGLHLFNKSKKVIQDAANEFQKADLEYICTGHCTKNRAYNILKEKLGDKLTQFHVGLHIRIE